MLIFIFFDFKCNILPKLKELRGSPYLYSSGMCTMSGLGHPVVLFPDQHPEEMRLSPRAWGERQGDRISLPGLGERETGAESLSHSAGGERDREKESLSHRAWGERDRSPGFPASKSTLLCYFNLSDLLISG